MALVFIVEDNQLIREAVSQYFQIDGTDVVEFAQASGVSDAIETQNPDLLILDVMLPDENGFVLAKQIRRSSDIPIMFLTARESESDRITGFEIGADDYVVKPFSAKELVLRAKALIRRTSSKGDDPETGLSARWALGDSELLLDRKRHRAFINGQELSLTASEWKILSYLASYDEVVRTRRSILGECLDYLHDGSERTVDTHIANIRNKLGDDDWIETVRGYGYRFCGEMQADGEA
ncbi:MAG: DNA-binding response regulator [Spirochaetaceae bacterium]|nr:MAG: DNA-binding response regulator [Spirochaetaceae bacterium]